MAITVQQLFPPTALPTTVGVLYSAAAVVKNARVRLTNTTAAAIAVTLYAAASATASGASNMCFPAKSIAANDFFDVDIPILASGDTLRGFSSAAGITIHCLDGVLYSA